MARSAMITAPDGQILCIRDDLLSDIRGGFIRNVRDRVKADE